MIKIKKEDNIVDILKKINLEESNTIKLDFPFGHPILHNHLSLKIIKTKAKNKDLFIISNDKTAKKISKLIGINFISKKNKEIKNISTQDILKQNYTFIEYTAFEIKTFFRNIKNNISGNIKNNKKINTIFYSKNKYSKTNKNIILYFLLILTLISFLFLYIYYIAINKTTIIISPEIITKIKSKNFTFIEKIENNTTEYNFIKNKIILNKINKKVFLSKTLGTSGIKQKKEDLSKGKIILYNYLTTNVSLLENTTLESNDGIQFYMDKKITIPSGKLENGKIIPGEKIITVFGKMKLLNGDYSGGLTNIKKGTLLIIPKLGTEKTKIFAKSITNFTGGTNSFTKILTQKDLNNAKKLLTSILKKEAIDKIKTHISNNNHQNAIKLELLPVNNIFKFTNLKINIPEHLKPGDEIDKFTINGEIEISSFTYNKQAVVSILKNSINDSIIEDSYNIISIDDEQLRISYIIKRNDLRRQNGNYKYIQDLKSPFIIKATTEIEYTISKRITKNNNFINKIKYSIYGKDITIAEKILINNLEINNVKIKVQPFFIKKISTIPNNIEIIIEK